MEPPRSVWQTKGRALPSMNGPAGFGLSARPRHCRLLCPSLAVKNSTYRFPIASTAGAQVCRFPLTAQDGSRGIASPISVQVTRSLDRNTGTFAVAEFVENA